MAGTQAGVWRRRTIRRVDSPGRDRCRVMCWRIERGVRRAEKADVGERRVATRERYFSDDVGSVRGRDGPATPTRWKCESTVASGCFGPLPIADPDDWQVGVAVEHWRSRTSISAIRTENRWLFAQDGDSGQVVSVQRQRDRRAESCPKPLGELLAPRLKGGTMAY